MVFIRQNFLLGFATPGELECELAWKGTASLTVSMQGRAIAGYFRNLTCRDCKICLYGGKSTFWLSYDVDSVKI